MRDLYSQGQAAFSNAQLEGQQATQMELQNQQTQLQLVQQKQAIMADTNLSDEQRSEQLQALGQSPEAVEEKQRGWDQWLTTGALGAAGLGITAVGVAKLAASIKVGTAVLAGATGAAQSAITLGGFAGAKAVLAGAGVKGVGGLIAAGFATNPVGWTIGAVIVGALAVGVISTAIKNNQ
jgi:hypothetical protein